MSHAERLGILLLGLLLFLPGIGGRDLWNPDEPRYAEVARVMRAGGDWLVPRLNGAIYAEKPPLLFWLIGAASYATGEVDEVAARLPSLVAGIATLFLLFGIARRLYDRRIAWASVLVFATSVRILWQARVGQIDMLLLACVTLAMYGFVRGWLENRRGFYRLFWIAAGLGTLAKGPVGLLPPLLSVALFVWLSGERSRLRELRFGTGLATWAGIVLLWLVPAAISGGEQYLQTLVFKQNVQRFADPWHHLRPFHYYLTTIPVDFFPWIFFLPGALWVAWRRSTGEERRGNLFAACWALATVLFFSISPAKRTVYVLQMFPALAMLVGYLFVEASRSGDRLRRWISVPAALLAGLFALAPLALPRVVDRREELGALGPGLLGWLSALAVALALAALLAWALALSGRADRTLAALAAGMAVVGTAAALLVLPLFQPLKSFRPIAEKVAELAGADDPIAIFRRVEAPLLFYSRRTAEILQEEEEVAELVDRASAGGRRAWLFIDRSDFERFQAPLPMSEVGASAPRGKSYLLLASPEPAAEPPAPPAEAAPAEPRAEP